MSQNEIRGFQSKLAFHTAPSLLGIKCASLLSVSSAEFDVEGNMELFNRRAKRKGLRLIRLSQGGGKCLILLYNARQLAERLCEEDSRLVLRQYGYTDDMTMSECLKRLAMRARSTDGFPHEIGIFLGYPAEDVMGFIRNNGGDFKLCGYWKVYGNAQRAQRTFENYNKCRRYLCGRLDQGEDFYHIIKIT